jgi:hypothetical protein
MMDCRLEQYHSHQMNDLSLATPTDGCLFLRFAQSRSDLFHGEMTPGGSVRAMTDDNIIGIDGRQAGELRKDQAEREQREEILRQKLKCLGFELQPGNMPGSYTIAHPPQPPYLKGWRDLSLEQVEDATSDIEIGQDPRFGGGALRAVRAGKPWRQGLPECYVERLDPLKHYYYASPTCGQIS